MPVLQLRQHIRQYTEQLLICHILCNSRPITLMNFIPVYIFIIEKTISFVHNRPQSLKITFRIICKIRFGNTRRKKKQHPERTNHKNPVKHFINFTSQKHIRGKIFRHIPTFENIFKKYPPFDYHSIPYQ